jgi:hypothetical protein
MKSASLLLLFVAASLTSLHGQESIVIPLKVEGNRTLVTVKIGDVVVPDLILDTGFWYDGIMIYNAAYLDSIDLTGAVQVQMGGAGSGKPATGLMIDSGDFHVGSVRCSDQRIIVLQDDIYKGFPSNGIIGYSIFGHYVTAFDYDSSTMTLYGAGAPAVDSSWASLPIYFKQNMIPWVDVSVSVGRELPSTLATYIDFAAGDAVVLLEKPGRKYPLPADTVRMFLGRGLSGDIYGLSGTISTLTIGPYSLANVRAAVADERTRSKQEDADAVLGNASLRRFNLIFDYGKKTLHLKPNTHFNDPW